MKKNVVKNDYVQHLNNIQLDRDSSLNVVFNVLLSSRYVSRELTVNFANVRLDSLDCRILFDKPKNLSISSPSTYKIEIDSILPFTRKNIFTAEGEAYVNDWLKITNQDLNGVLSYWNYFHKEKVKLSSEHNLQIDKIINQTIYKLDTYQPALRYFDFVYFSAVTQTSTGYGDILPNDTKVRLIVVSQIIIGIFILGVFINFSFKRK